MARTVEVLQSVVVPTLDHFDSLSREELESMAQAGQEIIEIHRILSKTGDNVVGEVLRGQGTFFEWDHYPPGDVYDHETHSQFYYHAHPSKQRFELEHGHFHTFLRPKGMPPAIKPAPVADYKAPKDPNDALSHLIGISMTGDGFAYRLFTVNRWVTGEIWYKAEDVKVLLDYFKIDHAKPSWPTNRWITAMIRLFRSQIVELLRVRDQTVQAWIDDHPTVDVYEDRNLEITSFTEINVENQVRQVAQALLERD